MKSIFSIAVVSVLLSFSQRQAFAQTSVPSPPTATLVADEEKLNYQHWNPQKWTTHWSSRVLADLTQMGIFPRDFSPDNINFRIYTSEKENSRFDMAITLSRLIDRGFINDDPNKFELPSQSKLLVERSYGAFFTRLEVIDAIIALLKEFEPELHRLNPSGTASDTIEKWLSQ